LPPIKALRTWLLVFIDYIAAKGSSPRR